MGVNLLKESDESGEDEEWRNPNEVFGDWRKQTPDLKAIAIGKSLWILQNWVWLKKKRVLYKNGVLGNCTLGYNMEESVR